MIFSLETFIGNNVDWKLKSLLETMKSILETKIVASKQLFDKAICFQLQAIVSELRTVFPIHCFQSTFFISNLSRVFQSTMFPMYVSK